MSDATSPAVSVIMNCRNGEKYLRQAIDSVYAQTVSDWEIVFWDTASTDASPSIAKSYGGRLRYFRCDNIIPLYAARNQALKQARGKCIGFLDCDDVWLPRKLEKQIPVFEYADLVGLVYSNVQILDAMGRARVWYTHDQQPTGQAFRALLQHYHLMLPSVMIALRALDCLSEGFDESLHASGDTDLFLRIAHDWKVAYVADITAQYREHGGNMTLQQRELYLTENDYIAHKLSRLYEGFRHEYRLELISFAARAQKGYVFNTFRAGRHRDARQLTLRHLSSVRSMFALYLLSFLPVRLTKNPTAHSLLRRVARRVL